MGVGKTSIAVIGMVALAICLLSKREGWLLSVCLRGVLGVIIIYFINFFLEKLGIYAGVGINALTVLTSGILGFPGVAALFGIGIYHFL
jgi:inhibitor of the pro-sigma K processing machinery